MIINFNILLRVDLGGGGDWELGTWDFELELNHCNIVHHS